MNDIIAAVYKALDLILSADPDLIEIVLLSFYVNGISVFLSGLIGLSLGAALAVFHFPGRTVLLIIINAFMGLPPVVVGLLVYMLISNAGPLGVLGLLYTPTAMIIAQTILITPLITALTVQSLEMMHKEYKEQLKSLGASTWQQAQTLLWDARYGLTTVMLAGLGRAISEVGAVMIVGGNINHLTRIMTTAIALETSKGYLSLALALGILLILLSFLVNGLVYIVNERAKRGAYA